MRPRLRWRVLAPMAAGVILAGCGTGAGLKREAHAVVARTRVPAAPVTVAAMQRLCWDLARQKLSYSFGSCRPENGGMDCSGTVHYVLSSSGYVHVPRQSNHQYLWLKEQGTMRHASDLSATVLRRMRPGDLMFWKGTYRTGRRWPNISHVMIYMGRDPRTGRHIMFGGRTSGQRGLNGAAIDFYPLREGESEGRGGTFVGYGRVPGLR